MGSDDDRKWATARIEALLRECEEIAKKYDVPFDITFNGGSYDNEGWNSSSAKC